MEVEFLPTCGAAQEKQSAAALPSLTPPALTLYFVWGFWPLAKTGAIPRTGFQVFPFPRSFVACFAYWVFSSFLMMLILPVAGMEDLDGMKVDYGANARVSVLGTPDFVQHRGVSP